MPQCSSPLCSILLLTVASKWGTGQAFTSTDALWKVKVETLSFTEKKTNIQFWLLIIPVSVEVVVHSVPHIKDPVNGEVARRFQSCKKMVHK